MDASRQILIWLLERYVLWAIGRLGAEDEAKLEVACPKLRTLFHAEGSWQEVLRAAMQWDTDPAAEIIMIWKKNEERARQHGEVIDPDDFARRFVGMNFVPDPH
ncbi:hypothetical protein D7V80_17995 [Corallococcus sp. CA054B]|uniref:hypothetical protein n=1 Tax=Corallococcus sp. CA054B TaxID=2316734 RepID=UPI000EA012F4|nr:hypothetical protein [Corallococcus sp. CA054B]RKG66919.1 hypothetical protein D7V80_17995 [Corallococcus sp. CA054B]